MGESPARQTEADTRRLEDVDWREKLRAEDLAWREKVRAEDLAWREKVRADDLVWREKARAANEQRLVRGLAFLAAAQNAKPGTPSKELARMAEDFTQWIMDEKA